MSSYIPLKNKFNDILAINIVNYDFSQGDIATIINLLKEYGIIVWKQTDLSVKEYYHWQLKLGYHQYANMWCSHKKYPIFFRVTNDKIDEKGGGLFNDQELDWHCNVLFTPEAEELLGLYARTIPATPRPSKTFFVNSLPYLKNLSSREIEELQGLKIKITDHIEQTYEKKLVHYDLPSYQAQDFVKQRENLDIRKSVNFEKKFFSRYPHPRFAKEHLLRLLPRHPLGLKGLYFPHFHIAEIINEKGRPCSQELYQKIKEEYLLSGRYIYTHQWEEGDIIIADQLTGLHRRNNIWEESPLASRELLRSACWYKTNYRQHFERSI